MGSKTKADHEVYPMVESLVNQYYPEIVEAGLTFDIDYAWPGKKGGPPLKLHGRPCAATIKKNHVDARRRGVADSTITLDGVYWASRNDNQKKAIIHHELEHIKIRRNKKTDEIVEDKADRPVFDLKHHDWEVSGFANIASIYKEDSIDVTEVRELVAVHHDLFWRWGDDQSPTNIQIFPQSSGVA